MKPLAPALIALLSLSILPARDAGSDEEAPPLFENVSEAAGLKGVQSPRACFADLDRDGWPDALIDRTQVFMNVPAPGGGRHFQRSAHDAAFQPKGVRRADGVQVGDVNNDGIPDLLFIRSTDLSNEKFKDDGLRHELWLGDGKGGWKKAAKPGFSDDGETAISACFVDFDNDGNLDVFIGNAYVAYGKSQEAFPPRLYKGRGDGTFTDVTEKAKIDGEPTVGEPDSRRPFYGVAHTDWNNDGLQDLFTMTYGRQINRLWKNNGDGTFTDVGAQTTYDADADRSGVYDERIKRQMHREDEPPFRANGVNFDFAIADFDGDGDMDGFLATIQHGWAGPSSDPSMLLENLGKAGKFAFKREPTRIPREELTLNTNHGDLHAGWLDVDNDGFLDLLIASSDYPDEQILKLYHQEPDGSFVEWTERLGVHWINASQITLGDFDRDGATDILVGTSNFRLDAEQQAAHSLDVGLLRNLEAARAGNGFLNLRLAGAKGKANRDAIGARVSIWTGEHRQTREVYGGQGCACHRDDTDCRFGVGKAKKVDRVEVRWPDAKGTVQTFTDVDPNKFYTLEQGGTLKEVPR